MSYQNLFKKNALVIAIILITVVIIGAHVWAKNPSPEKTEFIVGTQGTSTVLLINDSNVDSGSIQDSHIFTIKTDARQKVYEVRNFAFNSDKTKLYMSIVFKEEDRYKDMISERDRVYEIDLQNSESKLLWENIIGSDKYGSDEHVGKGALWLKEVVEQEETFIVFSMADCYACDGFHKSVLVLNADTQKDVYLENAGEVKIGDGVVTYKNLTLYEDDPCTHALYAGCVTFKPEGPTLSVPLP